MHTLINWRARRAGGRITVYGEDDSGASAKIVGVDVIEPRAIEGRVSVVAITKDNIMHKLII
jgi:hypothetical protein